jgi:hypothetical protein
MTVVVPLPVTFAFSILRVSILDFVPADLAVPVPIPDPP